MASTQDLKRRVRSISNTRKLTKAMELVASARLRRAAMRIEAMRPYAERMQELMAGTAKAAGASRQPLLERRDNVRALGIVIVAGDRGLAGAFNAQVLRRSLALMREAQAEGQEVKFFTVGKKAQSTIRFRGLPLAEAWTGFSDKPDYSAAQAIAHRIADAYVGEEVDRVVLVYNEYVSALVQRVSVTDLLPIPLDALGEGEETVPEVDAHPPDFFFEPEPRNILERLLPVYVETAALPGSPRVGGVVLRRSDDGDAERLEGRRRADRHPHAGHEQGPPGGDHAGDSRGRRGRRRPHAVAAATVADFRARFNVLYCELSAPGEPQFADDQSMTVTSEELVTAPAGTAAPSSGKLYVKSPSRLFWERFREDKAALVGGLVIIGLILAATIGAPLAAWITGHPNGAAYEGIMENSYGLPKGPNTQFWFGADGTGQDLFVRTLYGARTSLLVGVVASLIAVTIGLIVGMTAGYFRGWTDTVFSRSGDIMLALPQLLISIGIVAACTSTKSGCLSGHHPAGHDVGDRDHRALLVAVYRTTGAQLHDLDPREGVRRGEQIARRRELPDHHP